MEIGAGAGLGLLVLVLVVVFVLMPRLAANRTETQLTRTQDKESANLRILDTSDDVTATTTGHRILLHPNVKGGSTVTSASNHSVPVKRNRELAAARAARAAAASRRHAAAQRRLLATVLLTLLTLVLVGVAAAGIVTWVAAAVSSVVLVGVLGYSAVAAQRGAAEDARAQERIEAAQSNLAEVRPSVVYSPRRRDVVRIITGQVPLEQESATVEEAPAEAKADDATWTPMYIPKPSYQLKPLVQPRQIKEVENTEAKAGPSAPVPYRPRQLSEAATLTWSTVEVVEGGAVQLDIDKILDSRRSLSA